MSTDDWTTPADIPAGVSSRATINQQLPQNMLALFNAIVGDVQATGEVIPQIKVGTNAARPAAGNSGRPYYATDDPKCIYIDDGTNWQIAGGAVPHCRVTNSGSVTIGYDSTQAVAFNTERWDNDGMHDNVTNNTRITINKAGLYDVGGCGAWADVAGGIRQLGIRLNGTTQLVVNNLPIPAANGVPVQNLSCHYRFAAADYIEMTAYQNRTAASTTTLDKAANYSPEFWATFIGV